VKRMCALAKVSRAGFYRRWCAAPGLDRDVELRDAIQRIALESPSYGWPRMTRELQRRGWAVNHKRVYRLMREDNLPGLFVVTLVREGGLTPHLATILESELCFTTWSLRG
jgi:transposase InsO family protein